MPSVPHEILIHLVRNCGELAAELLRLAGKPQLQFASTELLAEVSSAEFNQIAPVEYRADQVTIFRDEQRRPVMVVIVEVQLNDHREDKRFTWPLYLAAAREQHRCPCVLLVITPHASVAKWARVPIELGHPGFCLEPLVISYPDVPPSLDFSLAHRVPALAVLSALAHPSLQAAQVAADAIRKLSPDQNRLYFDAIVASLAEGDRHILEANQMQGYVYQSNFARKYVAQGREEGLSEGREEGLEEGLSKGIAVGREQGIQLVALELARAKFPLAPEDEAAISAVREAAVLTKLVIALGQARSLRQARAAITSAVAQR